MTEEEKNALSKEGGAEQAKPASFDDLLAIAEEALKEQPPVTASPETSQPATGEQSAQEGDLQKRIRELEDAEEKKIYEMERENKWKEIKERTFEQDKDEARTEAELQYLALSGQREKLAQRLQELGTKGPYQILQQGRQGEITSRVNFGISYMSLEKQIQTPQEWLNSASTWLDGVNERLKAEPKDYYLERDSRATRESIDSFGQAALSQGDLETAITSFDKVGQLENPEAISQLRGKMLALRESQDPKDREKFLKASQILQEIQSRKEKKE